MIKHTKRLFLYALLICSTMGGTLMAQDPVFSQFYASPLHLNPAFTGTTEGAKVVLNYRNQWPGINQAYVTYAASYDQFFPLINSGFGVSVLADDAGRGLIRTTTAKVDYSYKVRFRNAMQMRLGVSAGWISSRVNWSQLVFPDQLDLEYGAVSPGGIPYPTVELPPEAGNSISVLDASVGIVLFTDQYYGGITIKHLSSPQFSFLKVNQDFAGGLPTSFSVHGGGELDLIKGGGGHHIFLSPNFQYIQQGAQYQLNIGTIFRYYKIGTGAWYRHASTNPDALIFLLEGRHEIYRIAYSYDFMLSGLSNSGGAHEISFMINFGSQQRESRYNDCFNMFR